jgi:hypothetical protein
VPQFVSLNLFFCSRDVAVVEHSIFQFSLLSFPVFLL